MDIKDRKRKKSIIKATSKDRLCVSNINQKSFIFADKRTKRLKTRQAIKNHLLVEHG